MWVININVGHDWFVTDWTLVKTCDEVEHVNQRGRLSSPAAGDIQGVGRAREGHEIISRLV